MARGARRAARRLPADVRVRLGCVNNDVGVNAAAAALELLLIVVLRRGLTLVLGLLTGALLIVLPIVKGTGYSLYPVAAIALLATLWRHHRRAEALAWAALAGAAVVARELSTHLSTVFHPSSASASTGAVEPGGTSASGAVTEVLHHPLGYARLPVGGVPAAAVVHGAAFPGSHAARVRDLRRTRVGSVWVVRRVVSRWLFYVILAVMLARGDPRGGGGCAGVELRAPQRARDGRAAADAARGRGGLRGRLLHDGRARRHRRIRPLRVPRDRAARRARGGLAARVRTPPRADRGGRPARGDDRAQLRRPSCGRSPGSTRERRRRRRGRRDGCDPRARRRRAARAHAGGAREPERRARAARVRLGLQRRLARARALARRARHRDPARATTATAAPATC